MNATVSLFQQQSYNDAWQTYALSLKTDIVGSMWDYVILTASNEAQAKAYREQIDYRLKQGQLPKTTHYAVLPDPDGKRVGSGGATLNVIRYVRKHAGAFRGKKMLVIHSGGDSKRVPQYSACGKLFSPVPRMLPDGRRSTLFDEFMIGMSGVPARMSDGMLICSGDVLLLFNALQIDFYTRGAAALSIKENVETGKNHGVYLKDENGNMGRFLHKQTVETLNDMGAVDARGNVDIDTGAVMLESGLLESLYGLIDTDAKFAQFVNEKARLSFYADFLYPLASGSTLEQFYLEKPEGDFTDELHDCRTALWEVLHPYRMKLIRLSPASFIHFGTTRELLKLMTGDIQKYHYLSWNARVSTNSAQANIAVSNSYISPRAKVAASSYIEDSYIHKGSRIGERCVISGVTLDGQQVPDDVVLHGLKIDDGRFVVRMYGTNDNPKEPSLFGRTLNQPLWTAPIYPVRDNMEDAVNATLAAWQDGFAHPEADAVSLMDSFNRADVTAILPWQEKLADKVKVESVLEAIDSRSELAKAIDVFHDGLSERAEEMLLNAVRALDPNDLHDFGNLIRIYYALARMKQGREQEEYMQRCFDTIRDSVLQTALEDLRYDSDARICKNEITVRTPVRVNWGGGWSDTPPYCMENGGTVLNAAVTLNGEKPIEVIARRLDEPKIILTSADNGSYREFTDVRALQDSSNPHDPFALHKAALIACGLVPYHEDISVEEIAQRLGGGVYLSTQVMNIPRGSGLGTSSILAGACVKALMEFTGKQWSDNELYNRVLCMEQIMSTGGGWQDQVGGLAPGVKTVTTTPGMHQQILCTNVNLSEETRRELNERLCLIYTGQRRLARNLLREVVGKYIAGEPEAVEVLREIQRCAVLMRFELEKNSVDGFAQLLSRHWELSKRLDAGCTNTCIDQIFLAIDDLIDGRMICGAGGGGFLQVVLKKGVTRETLQTRLLEVFQDSGVDVWMCELV